MRISVFTRPQSAQSNLWTARSHRVACGSITASLSGLRHFGQLSSIKRSKDRVSLLWRWVTGRGSKARPQHIPVTDQGCLGIPAGEVDWCPPLIRARGFGGGPPHGLLGILPKQISFFHNASCLGHTLLASCQPWSLCRLGPAVCAKMLTRPNTLMEREPAVSPRSGCH